MTSPHALIRSPSQADSERATPLGRVAWGLMGALAWAVVGTAFWLRPDARGFGTHEQLGLLPCAFSKTTGVPCPGCGLTTSFAHMAHGHPLRAFEAHLMGPVLFAMTLFIGFYAPWAIARAQPLKVLLDSRATLPLLALAVTLGVLTFGLRLAHVMHSG